MEGKALSALRLFGRAWCGGAYGEAFRCADSVSGAEAGVYDDKGKERERYFPLFEFGCSDCASLFSQECDLVGMADLSFYSAGFLFFCI